MPNNDQEDFCTISRIQSKKQDRQKNFNYLTQLATY